MLMHIKYWIVAGILLGLACLLSIPKMRALACRSRTAEVWIGVSSAVLVSLSFLVLFIGIVYKL